MQHKLFVSCENSEQHHNGLIYLHVANDISAIMAESLTFRISLGSCGESSSLAQHIYILCVQGPMGTQVQVWSGAISLPLISCLYTTLLSRKVRTTHEEIL